MITRTAVRLCGPSGPVVLLREGRLAKLREELVEAIERNRLRRGDLDAQRPTRRSVMREELTLLRIERHSGQLEELDVDGILAFAERVLPRAADLWVQASLDQRQRFQQLFVPDGIAFDGNRFIGTGVTAPAFRYLRDIETGSEGLVDQNVASWNRLTLWLRQVAALRLAA